MKKQPGGVYKMENFNFDSAIEDVSKYYKTPRPIQKDPTKTFIGGVVCTLTVIYIIFPLADYLTDTLLAYLMK